MDIPILKYIDILIGLAVVMILVSTIVTAVGQLILQSTYARARALQGGLRDLIGNLDKSLMEDARYFAERLIRHPLIGRANWMSDLPVQVRNMLRQELTKRLPLPAINPGSVVLREEFTTMLLEWAAKEGPLALQDEKLAEMNEAVKRRYQALADALKANGIADPAQVLADIRRLTIENERAHPDWPATRWRAEAILTAAASPALAKINGWFDNMSQRVTQQFAFQARIWTTILALLVCGVIQLDSFALVRRLSVDDKFRESLVEQGKKLEADRIRAQEEKKKAAADPVAAAVQQNASDRASEELRTVQQTLSQLREPKLQVIPAYLAWEKVEMAEIVPGGAAPSKLSIGPSQYPLTGAGASAAQLQTAIIQSGAPVDIYLHDGKMLLAARGTGAGTIALDAGTWKSLGAQFNRYGLYEKGAGIFLSWILVSLGAPFWYDVLKNALNLRSMIARKEEGDRVARQSTDDTQKPAGPGAAGKSDSEAGDLTATGGEG